MKRTIVADPIKIGITKKYLKCPMDDYLSFMIRKQTSYPYPGVLVISLAIVRVTIPKVLVDTRSALNILCTNKLKWMGIPPHFIRPYSNVI